MHGISQDPDNRLLVRNTYPGYMSRTNRKFRTAGFQPFFYFYYFKILHESKFPFVSRIEFIRSKLSNFSAHVSGVTVIAGRVSVG